MKKKIFTLLLTLAVAVCQGQEQYIKPAGTEPHDSVIYKTTIFFPQGQGNTIGKSQYAKMSNYLVKQGIAAERISFYGNGVDKETKNAAKARRADVQGVIRFVKTYATEPEIIPEPEKQETITEPEIPQKREVITTPQEQALCPPTIEPGAPV